VPGATTLAVFVRFAIAAVVVAGLAVLLLPGDSPSSTVERIELDAPAREIIERDRRERPAQRRSKRRTVAVESRDTARTGTWSPPRRSTASPEPAASAPEPVRAPRPRTSPVPRERQRPAATPAPAPPPAAPLPPPSPPVEDEAGDDELDDDLVDDDAAEPDDAVEPDGTAEPDDDAEDGDDP
jgi:hypothetical protein